MERKKIIIVIALILTIISIIGISVYKLTTKEEKNEFTIEGIDLVENKEILKDAEVENLKITNISLLTREGISTYSAQINNDTTTDITVDKLYVTFYEGDKVTKILALSNAKIKQKGKAYINTTSNENLTKTTKITYSIEKNPEESKTDKEKQNEE